jgi:hypothetical protein
VGVLRVDQHMNERKDYLKHSVTHSHGYNANTILFDERSHILSFWDPAIHILSDEGSYHSCSLEANSPS